MKPLHLEPIEVYQATARVARQKEKMKQVLCQQMLERENSHFAATAGVSQNNHQMGFVPAFCNTKSGASVISRFADGRPAPIHILDGLPRSWIRSFDEAGHVKEVHFGVVAGFLFNKRFYTRAEAARTD